ncbi:MAG: TolC family protein [Desulfobacterales bacterium]
MMNFSGLLGIVLPAVLLVCTGCAALPKNDTYSVEAVCLEYGGHEQPPAAPSRLYETENRCLSKKDAETGLIFPLTLSQSLSIAHANNNNLEQTAFRIERSKAMQALANAAFRPQLNVYFEYMQGDAPSAYLFKKIDQRMLPPNADFNDPGWFENYETGTGVQMNLFNGGRDYLAVQIAKQEVRISLTDRKSAVNLLTARVIQAFYNVLEAEKYIQIAEESKKTVSEQLRIMQVRYEGGGALKSDVLSLNVRLAESKENIVRARKHFQSAKAALANLMGLDPSVLTDSTEQFVEPDQMAPDLPDTYEKGVFYALANRPELDKIRRRIAASRMEVDVARAEYLPRIDLQGKYYLDDPDLDFHRNRENWTAGLMLSWDLFTGFSTEAKVDMAEAAVREVIAAGRQTVLDIKMDVKTAYLNHEAAKAAYRAARSSEISAEESYRLVERHYKGGAVTITRYLEAELDLNRARIRVAAAHYEKIRAAADMTRAIGKWADPDGSALDE